MAISKIIRVPKVEKPLARLCYEQPPLDSNKYNPMVHCDRKDGHTGKHSWEYEK